MRGIVVVLLLLAGGVRAGELHESTQWVMGSPLRIATARPIDPALAGAAVDTARGLQELLSTWRDDTPLARFNRLPAGEHTVVPPLLDYLVRARRDHARTGGAFDPSVGTLRVDPEAALGMHRLRVLGDRVVRPHDAFAIDPGGDGKGLAVDAVDAHLRGAGIEDFLVDFGGSSWIARGRRDAETPWRVRLRHGARDLGTVELAERALSISSTVQIDRGPDGEATRRHHLIDPRTREPITTDRFVAVLAPTALDAEVASTALAVDGAARADWLEDFGDVEVLVVEDGRVVVSGPSFAPATAD